jgi:hypothetical protein
MPGVTAVINPTASDLAERSQPTRVVLSKPDIYDTHGSLREFLARMAARPVARFQAFEIYRLAKPCGL